MCRWWAPGGWDYHAAGAVAGQGETFSEKIPRSPSWKARTHPHGDLAEMIRERGPLPSLPRSEGWLLLPRWGRS